MSIFKKSKKSEQMDISGKPDSLALAMSVHKAAKAKKMARGGLVSGENDKGSISRNDGMKPLVKPQWDDDTYSEQASRSFSKKPGEPDSEDFVTEDRSSIDDRSETEMRMKGMSTRKPTRDIAEEMEPSSVAEAIMGKRTKMFAEGGQVDIESNEEEESADLSPYDKRNEAVMKEHYGDDLDSLDQPMDSNEHGDDDLESDVHDMVSAIRKRMMSRR